MEFFGAPTGTLQFLEFCQAPVADFVSDQVVWNDFASSRSTAGATPDRRRLSPDSDDLDVEQSKVGAPSNSTTTSKSEAAHVPASRWCMVKP